jgi:hypothetical protein
MRPGQRSTLLALCLLLAFGAMAPRCKKYDPQLYIDTPVHGTFLNGTLVNVTGHAVDPGLFQTFTVNGIPIAPEVNWAVDVPIDPADVFNRISAEATLSSGTVLRDSIVIVVGDGVNTDFVADGVRSPQSVALRIEDTGLHQISPIVESLSGDALDISSLIAGQNPIATGNFGGIVTYTANVVEVGFGGFGLDASTSPTGIDGHRKEELRFRHVR